MRAHNLIQRMHEMKETSRSVEDIKWYYGLNARSVTADRYALCKAYVEITGGTWAEASVWPDKPAKRQFVDETSDVMCERER